MAVFKTIAMHIKEQVPLVFHTGNKQSVLSCSLIDISKPKIELLLLFHSSTINSGVHLRDLAFLDESNPDKIKNMINFSKRRRMSRVINNFLKNQSIGYKYHYVHQIAVLLKDFKGLLSEKELMEKALLIELSSQSDLWK